jgi:hypothetical protein
MAMIGVRREVVGIVGHQPPYFAGGDFEGGAGGRLVASLNGRVRRSLTRREAQYMGPTHFSPTPPTQEGAWVPVRMIVLLCSMYSSIAVRPSSRPMPEAP